MLGPSAPVCFMRMPDGCPIEQAISRQRLRPGSGFLSVKVTTDGPTRVLQITDVKQRVSEGSNFSLVVDSIEYSSSSLLDFNISVSGLVIQSSPPLLTQMEKLQTPALAAGDEDHDQN